MRTSPRRRRVEDVSYTTAEKYVTGNFDFEEEEKPQPSAQELALKLAATAVVDFKSTLLSFKRQASINRPANGGSQPMDAGITRGDAFEKHSKPHSCVDNHTVITQCTSMEFNGLNIASRIPHGFRNLAPCTRRQHNSWLEPFWSSLAPAALRLTDAVHRPRPLRAQPPTRR